MMSFQSQENYRELVPKLLSKADVNQPLVLILDGIDQLMNATAQSMEWLPEKLPKYCRIIMTANSSTKMSNTLKVNH